MSTPRRLSLPLRLPSATVVPEPPVEVEEVETENIRETEPRRQDLGIEVDAESLRLARPLEAREPLPVHDEDRLEREVAVVDAPPLPAGAECQAEHKRLPRPTPRVGGTPGFLFFSFPNSLFVTSY